ncbi:MAG TPA: hypothetical protein DCY13_15650 [Verrucomicrobiales bacterium]|nr:hypothetical protein [Verrucomicrobiales bacterium]
MTIRFENVTAEDALVSVLDTYSLQMIRDPKTRVARITIKDPDALPPLVTRVVQLNYANPTNLVSVITPTIDAKRSRVLADGRTRKLIIVATEKDQEAAQELIAKLDLKTEQVLIEGTIVETSKNPKTVKGIDWSGTFSGQNFTFGNQPNFSGGVRADTLAGLNPSVGYFGADGVNAVFNFLNSQTDAEIVATPRTVTLDNQPARLEVTTAFPIFKVTPGSANSPAGSEITYTNLGTILTVTPRIAADNNVSLSVIPEVSNLAGVDSQTVPTQDGEATITANIYAIRRFDTTVLIPSSSTLVLGGLMNDEVTDKEVKVPILGDLPGIGRAFHSRDKDRKKKNLMVFITPTILREDDFKKGGNAKEFLHSSYSPMADVDDSNAWESAKPHDWRKPVY